MKCHYCGEEVAENQSYCMWCGTRQEPQPETVPEEPVQQENCPREQPCQAPEVEFPVIQAAPVRTGGKYLPRLKLPTGRGLGKMIFLGILTLGIYPIVWIHGLCRRISGELKRRALPYEFGASTFWLWNVLGSLILVGPFVFTHKLMKSMNLLNGDFNVNG